MSKEIVLQELKGLILFMKEHNLDLVKKPEVRKIFNDKKSHVENLSKKLNSCELGWVDDNYGKFMREKIEPEYKEVIERARINGPLTAEQFQRILFNK